MIQKFYFKQFSFAEGISLPTVWISNSPIWPIDRTVSGATILDQSGHGRNGSIGELRIPQNSSSAGASQSDYLVYYPGYSLGTLTPLQIGGRGMPPIYIYIYIYCHIYIYIYIYCHPQTDYFVVSPPFSVARHARLPKLGSKPGWLKRQSTRKLAQAKEI